jgi:glycosyltransferase involved in cell wall biosynthesis
MTQNIQALKVLMVTPRYFPFMGGIETHVYEVGRRLVSSGIDVTLLTTIPQSLITSLPKEDEIEGMRIMRVRAWPQERDYYIAPEIYSIIQQGQWDLIHCQGCHTFVPPLAMYAAQTAKIPYLMTFHTGGHTSRLRTSIRGTQWRLQRPLMAKAAKLIGVSHFEANYFQQVLHLPAQRFSVIPNGAALPSLPPGAVKASTHPLIISVGRLVRYKGHQRLITALPKIREQRPDARLLILGAGPYETTLRELVHTVGVAEYVEIRAVPASDRQGMAELLSQATVVALLSEYEAHPIAVMEALALQRPVLVTNTSGLREIAEQGLARAIPLESTPEEVARAVLQQIEEPLVPSAHLVLPTWDDCARQLQSIYMLSSRRILCAS